MFQISSNLSYFQILFTTRSKRALRQSKRKFSFYFYFSFYFVILTGSTAWKMCWILKVLFLMSWKNVDLDACIQLLYPSWVSLGLGLKYLVNVARVQSINVILLGNFLVSFHRCGAPLMGVDLGYTCRPLIGRWGSRDLTSEW